MLALWRRFVQPVTVLAAMAIAVLPLVFTGRAMLTGRIYAPADLPFGSVPLNGYAADYGIRLHNPWLSDLSAQMIPWRAAVRHALSHGQWPLLNPFILGGDPLAASAQPAPYDPVNLVSLLIPLGPSLTCSTAMTFFLAALFTFAFARALGCSEASSLVAAAAWTFCGTMAFAAGWPLARAWAYLPLVLFATRATVREPRVANGALLTLGLVLTIVAGHPETVLHVVAIGVAYGVFELAAHRSLRAIGVAVIAGAVALLLTAFFLMPFADTLEQTVEHRLRQGHPPPVLDWPRSERRLGAAFLPFYGGHPWRRIGTPLYDPLAVRTGSIVLALGVAGMLFVRGRDKWFLAALALVSMFAAAELPPVVDVLHALPLFDITINHRLAWAATLATSLLAAMALDRLTPKRNALAMLVVAAVLAALTAIVWPGQLAAGVPAWLMRNVSIAELALLVLAATVIVRANARIAVPIILLLVLAQRAYVDGTIYPAVPARAFYPRVPVIDRARGDEPFRIVGNGHVMPPATGALYGLEDARGYQAMTFARLHETFPLWCTPQAVWFNRIDDLSKPFLSMMNVRYAIAPADFEPPPNWRVVLDDRAARLLENAGALPRAFIPRIVEMSPNDIAVFAAMTVRGTDYGERSWILDPDSPPRAFENGRGSLQVRWRGTELHITSRTDAVTWIVVSQTGWRGWRVYVDGERKALFVANHAFLGFAVPAGTHHVRLVYRPVAFVHGLTISGSTALLLLVWAVVRRLRAR